MDSFTALLLAAIGVGIFIGIIYRHQKLNSRQSLKDLPDMRVGRAAITISSHFSQKRFIGMFGDQSFCENWTISDALAVWYALGYFCYLFCVSLSGVFEPESLTPLLNSGYDQLLYEWKMPESVSIKFKAFVKANIGDITTARENIKDSATFNVFFIHFADRILGGNTSFANTSLVESLLRGEQLHGTDPILATALGALFMEADQEAQRKLRENLK